jgi:hypothetical protein
MEENTTRARLLYQVNGHGTQAFKLELNPDEGYYGAVIDGIFESLNHGWKLSPEGHPIITGAKEYAIISYYGYLPLFSIGRKQLKEQNITIKINKPLSVYSE